VTHLCKMMLEELERVTTPRGRSAAHATAGDQAATHGAIANHGGENSRSSLWLRF